MKKLMVAVLIAVIGIAFAVPASALENDFGGYFRVRMFDYENLNGVDTDDNAGDVRAASSRTRLYYTAKINDNLKLVNKFEMDATWGVGGVSYGDLGADGVAVEVKNTYAEFTFGGAKVKAGTQGAAVARGFIMDDDFSGINISLGDDNMKHTFIFAKIVESGPKSDDDCAAWMYLPKMKMGNANLGLNFIYKDEPNGDNEWWIGGDVDVVAGAASAWGTLLYNGGETGNNDIGAYLAAAGAGVDVGQANIHGQIVYASGDDNFADDDDEVFNGLSASYYWAELMGFGVIDEQISNNSCGDKISNITFINLGASMKPNEKTKVGLDLWHAELNENNNINEELGTELDLTVKYELVEGLNVDVVGAYLFVDDGTTNGAADDDNAYELGTQLSLSF